MNREYLVQHLPSLPDARFPAGFEVRQWQSGQRYRCAHEGWTWVQVDEDSCATTISGGQIIKGCLSVPEHSPRLVIRDETGNITGWILDQPVVERKAELPVHLL